MRRGAKAFVLTMLAMLAWQVSAPVQAGPLWASLNLHSEHYTRKQVAEGASGYNRDTLGVGVEYVTTPSRSWLAGWYHNSHHRPSLYAAVAEQPFNYGAFKAGGMVGVVSGYPAGEVIPMLAIVASYDGRRYGTNLIITPPIARWANGSISLQVKASVDLFG